MRRCWVLVLLGGCSTAPEAAGPEKEWRDEIRSTLFIPDPLPPLESRAHGHTEIEPGIVAERVTYGTQFGLRIPAILYRPASPSGKVPGLVVVNGHGGDKFSWYAYWTGILYARAGAVVLTFDPIGEGERNVDRKSGTRAHDKKHDPPELARRLAGFMITDAMQAVSYLRGRSEVDPARIAVMGYSVGSFLTGLLGAVDTRIKACILAGGGNFDGPEGYWDRSKPMCQGIPYRSLRFLGDRPTVIYALHADRGPTLIYNGLEDNVVGITPDAALFFDRLQDRVACARGTRIGLFETEFEPSAAHRPYFVTRRAALWLERELDLPKWTPAEIRAMPETVIGEWAAGTAIIDRGYASERHEGGTRALGAGVPQVPRESLFVFSAEDWSREKPRMIYESWLEKAQSALTGP